MFLLWVLCHLTGFARLVWGTSNVLLKCVAVCRRVLWCVVGTVHLTATKYNTLQHTMKHCNTLLFEILYLLLLIQQRNEPRHERRARAHSESAAQFKYVTFKYVRHDAFTWHSRICYMTHSYLWRDWFVSVTCLWISHVTDTNDVTRMM